MGLREFTALFKGNIGCAAQGAGKVKLTCIKQNTRQMRFPPIEKIFHQIAPIAQAKVLLFAETEVWIREFRSLNLKA